ncbi:MAG: hypothetical protein ACC628_27265 [Pirellulaceae bacterium]
MFQSDRRQFLEVAACAGLGTMVGRWLPGEETVPRLNPASPDKWAKKGVVLAPPTEPEGCRVQNFTCPAEPLERGRWRIWYSMSGRGVPFNVGYAEGVPGEPLQRYVAVLNGGRPLDAPFSIGNLPSDWRPVQVVHIALPSNRHRIYFWAHGPHVVRYLCAESNDGRRYSVIDPWRPCLYHPFDRAVDGKQAAAAGLNRLAHRKSQRPAGEPAAQARLISNDATNVYRLDDGTYEMYSVALMEAAKGSPGYVAHDNAAGWIRVIDRYVSEDGLNWTDRRRILVPDENDPADQQFYYLSVTHTPRGRVGLLGHYRVEAQTMDLEWCFSSDGIRWERPQRGPWLARGKPGEPDSYGIYAPHAMVFHSQKWHLFYTGVNSAHNQKHSYGKPASVVMHAVGDSLWT